MGERRRSATFVRLSSCLICSPHALVGQPGFFGLAVMLWLSGRRNPDEVIGLLEKLLAALLVVVVLLESRNMLLESLALLAVLQCRRRCAGRISSLFGLGLHLADRDAAGAGEQGMGCFHGVPQVTGLEHLLPTVHRSGR